MTFQELLRNQFDWARPNQEHRLSTVELRDMLTLAYELGVMDGAGDAMRTMNDRIDAVIDAVAKAGTTT